MKHKKKKNYSNSDKIAAILWAYLGIDKVSAEKLFLQLPDLLNADPSRLNNSLKKLCHEYLLRTNFVKSLICTNLQKVLDISSVTNNELFFRETFNLNQIEYGQAVQNSLLLANLNPDQIQTIIFNLKNKLGKNNGEIKNILLNSDYFHKCLDEQFIEELITKTKILLTFGIPRSAITFNPAILGNSTTNTIDKLILYSMTGLTSRGYATGKFLYKKEKAYARVMAAKAGIINYTDSYISDFELKKKYGVTTTQLMALFPWESDTHQRLSDYLRYEKPELATKISSILSNKTESLEILPY